MSDVVPVAGGFAAAIRRLCLLVPEAIPSSSENSESRAGFDPPAPAFASLIFHVLKPFFLLASPRLASPPSPPPPPRFCSIRRGAKKLLENPPPAGSVEGLTAHRLRGGTGAPSRSPRTASSRLDRGCLSSRRGGVNNASPRRRAFLCFLPCFVVSRGGVRAHESGSGCDSGFQPGGSRGL